MSCSAILDNVTNVTLPAVGVGLRHAHFSDALTSISAIDFVEIHAENFFADGGATIAVLEAINTRYAISVHSTAMGLGSAKSISDNYCRKLARLVDKVNPILLSDHASYSWSELDESGIHAGDLLPLSFNKETLLVLANNVDRVQQLFGRQILVENLSSYIDFGGSTFSEMEFLTRLTEVTGCGLLLDLNNMLVSAHNIGVEDRLACAKQWIDQLPATSVGELHLAGYSPVPIGELAIDDHSQAVSPECWELYGYAIKKLGAIPTLIEWDNNIPSWGELLNQTEKARRISSQVLKKLATSHER